MIYNPHFLWTASKLAMGFGVVSLFYLQPFRPVCIQGRSMEPTYAGKSMVLSAPVEPSQLHRGDVIVIRMHDGPIIKRIALMSGDKFTQVRSGPNWFDLIDVKPKRFPTYTRNVYRQVTIPPGQIYVLGDNAEVSFDSRDFGCIPISSVESKLVDQRPYTRPVDVL